MNTKTVTYPNRLKELRKVKGLRQVDVARRLGFVSEERISSWEQGKAVPSLVNLFKLAKGVSYP